jgi:hypothetical protein
MKPITHNSRLVSDDEIEQLADQHGSSAAELRTGAGLSLERHRRQSLTEEAEPTVTGHLARGQSDCRFGSSTCGGQRVSLPAIATINP